MSQSLTHAPVPTVRRRPWAWPVTFAVERTDRLRVLTLFAVAGLVAGGLMAVYGLPPFDNHGPLYQLGFMCPFCGATRSVRFAMMGEWGTSFQYNPIGIPLVLGASFLVLRTAVGAATRRWLNVGLRWNRLTVTMLVVALAVLWVNQQLHVELIGP